MWRAGPWAGQCAAFAFPVTPPAQSHTGTIVTSHTGDQEPGYSQEMSYYQAPSSSYGVPQAPPLDSGNSFYTGNNNNLPQPQQAAFYLYRGDTGYWMLSGVSALKDDNCEKMPLTGYINANFQIQLKIRDNLMKRLIFSSKPFFIIVAKSECKRRWIWCRYVQYLARIRGWRVPAGEAGRGRPGGLHHLRGGRHPLHDSQLLPRRRQEPEIVTNVTLYKL